MRTAVLVVSTSASRRLGPPDDLGPVVAGLAEDTGSEVVAMEVVPDDLALIEDRINAYVDDACELILTAGGIGPDSEHVTPEATLAAIDRELPGIQEAIRAQDPGERLSRGVAGMRGTSLVVNLPGTPEAARRAFEVLAPLVRSA